MARFHSTPNGIFEDGVYTFQLPENSADYRVIGTVHYGDHADPDQSSGRTLYTLGGPDRHKLRLSSDGIVRLGRDVDLDAEGLEGGLTQLQFTIAAVHFGAGGMSYQRTGISRVVAQDVDEPPEITLVNETTTIAENDNGGDDGLVIATFTVDDEDNDRPIETTLSPTVRSTSGGLVENPFEVVRSGSDNETVKIRLKEGKVLDFELYGATLNMTLTATSTGSSNAPLSTSRQITLDIENVNEDITFEATGTSISGDSQFRFEVAENQQSTEATSIIIGRVFARDGDDVDVTYRFVNPPTDKFSIDRDTGEITLNVGAELDHEDPALSDGKIELLVEASSFYFDMNGTRQESVARQTFTVQITDVEESPDLVMGTAEVSTSVISGKQIETVTSFLQNAQQVNGQTPTVTINERTLSEIKSNPMIEQSVAYYRVSDPDDGSSLLLTGGTKEYLKGIFGIVDMNEIETHGGGKMQYFKVSVEKPKLLDYESIYDSATGRAEFIYYLIQLSNDGTTSRAKMEDAEPYQQLRVIVEDVAEQVAFEDAPDQFTLSENSLIKTPDNDDPVPTGEREPGIDPRSLTETIVGSVRAVDQDIGDEVEYEITGTHAEKFRVNENGDLVLRAGAKLDYEALNKLPDGESYQFDLQIEAFTVRGGQRLTTAEAASEGLQPSVAKTVTIIVEDVDEAPLFAVFTLPDDSVIDPILNITDNGTGGIVGGAAQPQARLTNEITLEVTENELDAVLGTFQVRDPEGHEVLMVAPPDGETRYGVRPGADGGWELYLMPGVHLDKEAGPDQAFDVVATSMNTSGNFSSTILKVKLDIQDAPEVNFTGVTIGTDSDHQGIIQIGTEVGTVIGQANAEMVVGQPFTFSLENLDPPVRQIISDPASYFTIDAQTGEITLAKELIQVESHDMRFKVVATAQGQRHEEEVTVAVNKLAPSDSNVTIPGSRIFNPALMTDWDGDILSFTDIFLERESDSGFMTIQGDKLTYRAKPGFVGWDVIGGIGLRDDRGGETKTSLRFDVRPTLSLLEGQAKSLTASMFTSFASGKSEHLQIIFTAIPDGGVMTLTAADGTVTTVQARSGDTDGTVISIADIAAGRLSYRAPADRDDAYYSVPRFVIQDMDSEGNRMQNQFGEPLDEVAGHLTIAVSDLAAAVRTQIADSDNITGTDNPLLKYAYDIEFVSIGSKVFVVVSGLGDAGLSVFEFDPDSQGLTFRSQMADSDAPSGENWGMKVAHGIAHLQKGDKTFVYITGSAEHGITVFELSATGMLTHAHTLIDNYNNDIAMVGVGSMTLARFDDPANEGSHLDYLVTSGRYDQGVSVFRIGDDGGLTHLNRYTGTVRDSDGNSLTLSGESAGTLVTIAQKDADGNALTNADGDAATKTYYIGGFKQSDTLAVFEMSADGTLSVRDIVKRSDDTANLELDWPFLGAAYAVNGQHYIAVPGRDDDGVSVFAIAQDGTLTHHQSIADDASRFRLDKPSDAQHFTFEGEHYLAFTGHDDDGVTLFRVDSRSAKLEWVETLRDTEPSDDDSDELLLDGANMMAMHRFGDKVVLAVTGIEDNGFTLFDIDLDAPPATNPAEVL